MHVQELIEREWLDTYTAEHGRWAARLFENANSGPAK
jgi:hypothetical protein